MDLDGGDRGLISLLSGKAAPEVVTADASSETLQSRGKKAIVGFNLETRFV